MIHVFFQIHWQCFRGWTLTFYIFMHHVCHIKIETACVLFLIDLYGTLLNMEYEVYKKHIHMSKHTHTCTNKMIIYRNASLW